MTYRIWTFLVAAVCTVLVGSTQAAEGPATEPADGKAPAIVKDTWNWPEAMQKVASQFKGTEGVVLHIGDSITYANPYGSWARYGKGKTESDKKVLDWMHAGKGNDLDGWYLAAHDQPGGRSYTAAGGMRLNQALEGGFHGLPSIAQMLDKYNPQVVILMLGTNDASAKRPASQFAADLEKAIRLILDNHTIPVLSTIPPHINQPQLAQQYNTVIVQTARRHQLPLIDFYGEIVSRRPGMTWNGTLLNKGDVHPTASAGDASAGSEPTPENLRNVGYLLRGWLSVQKVKQVKQQAIDPAGKVGE